MREDNVELALACSAFTTVGGVSFGADTIFVMVVLGLVVVVSSFNSASSRT